MYDNVACKSHSHVAPQASRYHLSVQSLCCLLGSDREAAAESSRATKATLSMSLYPVLCEYITLFFTLLKSACIYSAVYINTICDYISKCPALLGYCKFNIFVRDLALGPVNFKWAFFTCTVNDLNHLE